VLKQRTEMLSLLHQGAEVGTALIIALTMHRAWPLER
jgi:hypothetical protein